MEKVRVVEIKEDILSRNNERAKEVKDELARRGVYYLNVMASPGSGKTTLLVELINALKGKYRIGVIEADIDGDVDAGSISEKTGVSCLQMHTAGACHITYQMSWEALESLGTDGLDLVILENVGNLVCPAEFDTGATANLVLLSVPEGDDKPLKYPLMFSVADMVAITKKDVLPAFDFSFEAAERNVRKRNPDCPLFLVSAKTGEGVPALASYLEEKIAEYRERR